MLAGCSSERLPSSAALNARQATVVARQLANEKSAALYGSRPFWDGEPARFMDGRWFWSDRLSYGRGDMEAMIVLAQDGTPQSVDVMVMTSQSDED